LLPFRKARNPALCPRHDAVDLVGALLEAFLILFPLLAVELRLAPGRSLLQRASSDAI
jgi:hypothetical protein